MLKSKLFRSVNFGNKWFGKIESLCFDGGNEIYHILKPDWDGEDSLFDVISVEGFQNLKNLKTVEYISMCYPKVLEPLKQAGIEVED